MELRKVVLVFKNLNIAAVGSRFHFDEVHLASCHNMILNESVSRRFLPLACVAVRNEITDHFACNIAVFSIQDFLVLFSFLFFSTVTRADVCFKDNIKELNTRRD